MKKLQNTVQKYISKLFNKEVEQNGATTSMNHADQLIKRYTKSELADLYKKPVYSLMRWIKNDEDLYSELKATGYRTYQKEFKKEQVRIIFRHLGEPDYPQ